MGTRHVRDRTERAHIRLTRDALYDRSGWHLITVSRKKLELRAFAVMK